MKATARKSMGYANLSFDFYIFFFLFEMIIMRPLWIVGTDFFHLLQFTR